MFINEIEFKKASQRSLVDLKCDSCGIDFKRIKVNIVKTYSRGTPNHYCCKKCQYKTFVTKQKVNCLNCDKEFFKLPSNLKKSPNSFCGRSCMATYNNKHKKIGINRSKAEQLIESLIQNDFPELELLTNDRSKLEGLELDIYIPSLNLAIELNGPVHYFPIYGQEKLEKIQNKDLRKQVAIQQAGINMIVIDISTHKYWKKSQVILSKYYLEHLKPLLII